MSDAASNPASCHNCGAVLHGPFCARCGQEARPLNPTLREVVHEVVPELLNVDGRIFRTVRRLFLSPGFLTREQFEGRRARWMPPFRLYLIFSVAYFAVALVAGSNVRLTVTGESDQETVSELRDLGFSSEQELRDTLAKAEATWMPRVMFVLVPIFAGLVHLVRRGSGRQYPQHVLFALHVHAAWFGVRALASAGRFAQPALVGDVSSALSVLYGVGYVFVALRVAYDGTRGKAARDTAVVLGIYWICVVVATLAVVLPPMFWRRFF